MSPPPLFQPGRELPILWENPHYVMVNKPSGLAVHPGPRATDSVEARLVAQKRGGPWLAHRLDTDTAGCLLIAKRKTALIAAQEAFAQRLTTKHYWALVRGKPAQESGEITAPLRKISTPKGWKMAVAPASSKEAQSAHTRWKVLGHHSQSNTSWLELELLTGRTHQARLHCAALGTPILGDRIYHPPTSDAPETMQLLARSLRVPCGETLVEAIAEPEPDMARLIAAMKT